jgi:TNF receptor-associated factor 2
MVITCVECNWSGKYIDYKNHYKIHEKINCPHCQITFSNDEQLKNHLDEKSGNCEQQPMQCIYASIGCCNNHAKFNRKTLQEHSYNNVQTHLDLVYNDLEPRIKKVENHYQSYNISESVATTSNLSLQIESSIIDSEAEKANTSLGGSNQKGKGKSQRETSDTANKKSKSSDNEEMSSKISTIEYKVDCVEEGLNTYIRIAEKLNKELEDTKSNQKKLQDEIDNLQKSLTFAQATIINLEERLLAQEKVSYNGTLVWKITNVRDKIQEAKSGRQSSIYSPPFYTHQNGFKMCGRIYLNGDGMGRNTHVSLFFVIMRGEYDSLLRWPFRQKVTFILLDQSNNENKENVIDAFRPDPNSNSFKKPTSDMNIASGIPLFCPLAKLNSNDHEYVKDDCMFIKIIIDSRDLIDI